MEEDQMYDVDMQDTDDKKEEQEDEWMSDKNKQWNNHKWDIDDDDVHFKDALSVKQDLLQAAMEEEIVDDINEENAAWKTVNNQKDNKVRFMTQNQNNIKTTMSSYLVTATRKKHYPTIRMDTSEDIDQATKQYLTAKELMQHRGAKEVNKTTMYKTPVKDGPNFTIKENLGEDT
eukprot:4847291-Ditylum_brightwellii.AAC.1